MDEAYVVSFFLAFLPSATQTEDKMKGRFFLDVIVVEGPTILELFSSED